MVFEKLITPVTADIITSISQFLSTPHGTAAGVGAATALVAGSVGLFAGLVTYLLHPSTGIFY